MLGTKGEFVGEGCRVDVRPEARVLCDILHTFPVIIDNVMKILKTLNIIIFCNNSFHLFSP
jgi:hypothetical protein